MTPRQVNISNIRGVDMLTVSQLVSVQISTPQLRH
jgi:hypothetical protein